MLASDLPTARHAHPQGSPTTSGGRVLPQEESCSSCSSHLSSLLFSLPKTFFLPPPPFQQFRSPEVLPPATALPPSPLDNNNNNNYDTQDNTTQDTTTHDITTQDRTNNKRPLGGDAPRPAASGEQHQHQEQERESARFRALCSLTQEKVRTLFRGSFSALSAALAAGCVAAVGVL